MEEQKSISTAVFASTITGVVLSEGVTIAAIHECVEHLFGAPVWTHELPDEDILRAVTKEGRRQFPDMPTGQMAREDYTGALRVAVERYGETVTVKAGHSVRERGPIESAVALLSGSQKGGDA